MTSLEPDCAQALTALLQSLPVKRTVWLRTLSDSINEQVKSVDSQTSHLLLVSSHYLNFHVISAESALGLMLLRDIRRIGSPYCLHHLYCRQSQDQFSQQQILMKLWKTKFRMDFVPLQRITSLLYCRQSRDQFSQQILSNFNEF